MKEIGTANFFCNIPTDLEIPKSLVNKQGKNAVPFIELISFSEADGPTIHQGIMLLLRKLGSGPGSSVGIATEYELDGPGSNPGGDACPDQPWGQPSLL